MVIPPGEFHKYERNQTYEYISVSTADGKPICTNLETPANKSLIITKDNQVKDQMYGDSNLFRDRYGEEH